MDKEPGGLQSLGLQNQTDWEQNHVLNAGTHAYTQTHTNACMHGDLPAPGPREEAASWEHLDFVHIWKRHICLSWNMSRRSKCLIWQAFGRMLNCSVMETGRSHLFFPFFFPGGCHLQALSLPHYSLLYLPDRSLYSNLSPDFCYCHHTGNTSRSPGTEGE